MFSWTVTRQKYGHKIFLRHKIQFHIRYIHESLQKKIYKNLVFNTARITVHHITRNVIKIDPRANHFIVTHTT